MNTAPTITPARSAMADVASCEHWQLLVTENDASEDGLWATPEGRLFLWQEPSRQHEPRAVTLEQATAWWQQFHQADPVELPMYFPEDSAAFRFTDLLAEAVKKRDRAKQEEITAAIDQAEALCMLLQHRLLFPGGASSGFNDNINCGLVELEAATFRRLRQATAQPQ